MTTDAITVPEPRSPLRNYTRWQQNGPGGTLAADILGTGLTLEADPVRRAVLLDGRELSPDEARLIGVRLIDAAVLADGERAIRSAAPR